jgi:hypothetical protein
MQHGKEKKNASRGYKDMPGIRIHSDSCGFRERRIGRKSRI